MRIAEVLRIASLAAWLPFLENAPIRVYSGVRPAGPSSALSGNTLLAELTGAAAFAPSPTGPQLVANAITGDPEANATGTPSFVRIFADDGVTGLLDLSVSVTGSGGEVQFSSLSFVEGVPVGLASLVITFPLGT